MKRLIVLLLVATFIVGCGSSSATSASSSASSASSSESTETVVESDEINEDESKAEDVTEVDEELKDSDVEEEGTASSDVVTVWKNEYTFSTTDGDDELEAILVRGVKDNKYTVWTTYTMAYSDSKSQTFYEVLAYNAMYAMIIFLSRNDIDDIVITTSTSDGDTASSITAYDVRNKDFKFIIGTNRDGSPAVSVPDWMAELGHVSHKDIEEDEEYVSRFDFVTKSLQEIDEVIK